MAGMVAILFVSGCGNRHDAAESGVVTYNCSANATEIQSLQKDIPLFKSRSGIDIRLNPFSGDDKLYAMIAAGQPPDIFYTNNVVRDRLAAEGHLLDLRILSADDGFIRRLHPDIVAQGRSADSGWYSVTNWVFTCGVYYNRQLFDAAHIPYPDSTWNWDQMVSIASRLTHDRDGDGKPEQYGIYIPSHFVEAFEQMNHAPVQRHALFVRIPPEAREVYRRYLSLMERRIMPDTRRIQAMGMQAQQLLESGRVAMLVEAVPHTGMYETMKIRWGVAPLPRFEGRSPLYFRSASGGLSVSATVKNSRAAWEALKWILAEAATYQPNPVLRDLDAVSRWEAKYPSVRESGFRDVWERSLRFNGGDTRFFVRFSSWTMGPIMERLQPLLDRLWSRQIGVDELVASVPGINEQVRRELDLVLQNPGMRPAFKAALERQRRGEENQ